MKHNTLNNSSPLILIALLIGALMALLSARARQAHQEQAKPVGCLTAQQVLNLSEPICHAVAAHPGPLTLTAEASQGLHDSWNVVCSDAVGHDLLVLTWNADTGELSEVGACRWENQRHSGPLLNSASAITLGRYWLRSLRVSSAADDWRLLASSACLEKHLWNLQYATKGHRVHIDMEAHTGALESARLSVSR